MDGSETSIGHFRFLMESERYGLTAFCVEVIGMRMVNEHFEMRLKYAIKCMREHLPFESHRIVNVTWHVGAAPRRKQQ